MYKKTYRILTNDRNLINVASFYLFSFLLIYYNQKGVEKAHCRKNATMTRLLSFLRIALPEIALKGEQH